MPDLFGKRVIEEVQKLKVLLVEKNQEIFKLKQKKQELEYELKSAKFRSTYHERAENELKEDVKKTLRLRDDAVFNGIDKLMSKPPAIKKEFRNSQVFLTPESLPERASIRMLAREAAALVYNGTIGKNSLAMAAGVENLRSIFLCLSRLNFKQYGPVYKDEALKYLAMIEKFYPGLKIDSAKVGKAPMSRGLLTYSGIIWSLIYLYESEDQTNLTPWYILDNDHKNSDVRIGNPVGILKTMG